MAGIAPKRAVAPAVIAQIDKSGNVAAVSPLVTFPGAAPHID